MQQKKKSIHVVFLAFVTYFSPLVARSVIQNTISPRIVGGTKTSTDNAKFLVNLRIREHFICGGSLVSSQFVVTAAHCVDRVNPALLTVVGGTKFLTDNGVRRSVLKVIKPKNYNQPKAYHMDVAVLKLSQSMVGANIETIPLCKAKWKAGDFITVYGWGQLSESNAAEVNQLREVQVPLVLRRKCIEAYRNIESITHTMFCAGDLKRKDSCYGDSGGPALFQNQLCGVVSWGLRCASNKFPGIYTSINSVQNFIEKAMKL